MKEFKINLIISIINYITEWFIYIINLVIIAKYLALALALKCCKCDTPPNNPPINENFLLNCDCDSIETRYRCFLNILKPHILSNSNQSSDIKIDTDIIETIFSKIPNIENFIEDNMINDEESFNNNKSIISSKAKQIFKDIHKNLTDNIKLDDIDNLSKKNISNQCNKIINDYINTKL